MLPRSSVRNIIPNGNWVKSLDPQHLLAEIMMPARKGLETPARRSISREKNAVPGYRTAMTQQNHRRVRNEKVRFKSQRSRSPVSGPRAAHLQIGGVRADAPFRVGGAEPTPVDRGCWTEICFRVKKNRRPARALNRPGSACSRERGVRTADKA
jgi:hypothetical protein